MRNFILALALVAVGAGAASSQENPNIPALPDEISAKDTVMITVSSMSANQVKLEAYVANSIPLGGITIPIAVASANTKLKFDSASFASARTEYFQLKSVNVPTPDSNSLLVGLIADLSGTKPPLAKGQGTVVTAYYTASKPVKAEGVTVKPVRLLPSNELEFISPDAMTRIRPTFVLKAAGAADKPKPKEK